LPPPGAASTEDKSNRLDARASTPLTAQGPLGDFGFAPPAAEPCTGPAQASPVATAADGPASTPTLGSVRGRAVVAPLAPERFRLQVTIGAETHARLRRAQDLLRHAIPDGDVAEVLDRALTLLVKELERARFAATGRPRKAEPSRAASAETPRAARQHAATAEPSPRGRQARRVGSRRGSMCLRGRRGQAVHRAQATRVPPYDAVRGWW
jgi:hypothetical protein